MSDTYNPTPRFGAIGIIGTSIRLFFANIQKLFLLAFVPLAIYGLLSFSLVGVQVFDPNVAAPNLSQIFTPAMVVLGVVSILMSVLVYSILIMASYDAAIGETSPLAQYISHGLKSVVPLVVLSILFVIMFYLGVLLFLLPGLYLMAVFVVLYQTVLIDGAGWKGLQASAALTKGYRWPVLGSVLLVVLISLAPFLILLMFTGASGMSGISGISGVVISSAFNAVMYGFNATFSTQVYLRLTELKRGGARGDVAEVFR